MNIIYSGKTKEFTPELEKKLGSKLGKLSKFFEMWGEREAHVIHTTERHLHNIEITTNFYDHALVGQGSASDLETSVCDALEKLEKQIVKLRARLRDTQRDKKGTRSNKESWETSAAAKPPAPAPANGKASSRANGKVPAAKPAPAKKAAPTPARKPKVFNVDYNDGRKPMTLDEAMIEMEGYGDYFVYRDSSKKNGLSVLVRRPDGHLDLIES
jgi:putative sigma-54 modulation protein